MNILIDFYVSFVLSSSNCYLAIVLLSRLPLPVAKDPVDEVREAAVEVSCQPKSPRAVAPWLPFFSSFLHAFQPRV